MRGLLAALVVLCFCTGPAMADGAGDVKAGLELLQGGKYGEARNFLTAALESQELSPQQRGLAHLLRGLSNMALGDTKAARVDLDQAIELMADDGTALQLRADLAWRTGDRGRALEDVLRLAREYPADLRDVELSVIWGLWRWLRDENRADDQFILVEAVVRANYQPNEPGRRADGLVQEYMAGLIRRGQSEAALPWVEKIINAQQLVEMRASGAFKPLWDKPVFDAHTRPRKAVERERDHWQAETEKHPAILAVLLRRIQALRMLGEWKPAAALARGALDKLDSFKDREEYGPWIRNELAYIYRDTGRAGDAMAAMKPVLDIPAKGQSGLVSQLINFGTILIDLGKPREALEAVAGAKGGVSPFGQKFIDSIEACANHRLGRNAEAEAAMIRLKTNPEENYSALSVALLCLNRVDEAVQLALVRLRDPDHRDAMLMNLQTFNGWPDAPSLRQELRERLKKVANHPDVVAEAKKHGRLLDIPLYTIYWGDV